MQWHSVLFLQVTRVPSIARFLETKSRINYRSNYPIADNLESALCLYISIIIQIPHSLSTFVWYPQETKLWFCTRNGNSFTNGTIVRSFTFSSIQLCHWLVHLTAYNFMNFFHVVCRSRWCAYATFFFSTRGTCTSIIHSRMNEWSMYVCNMYVCMYVAA